MNTDTLTADEEEALEAVCRAATTADVCLFVIGAGARLMRFDWPHRVSGRATTDWDLALRVLDWPHFEALIAVLTSGPTPDFLRTSEHRLRHARSGVQIDLVPFGGLQDVNATIRWPGTQKPMSVIGFEEAFEAAELLSFGTLRLRVVSLSAFVGLKLLAHTERAATKDLTDVDFVLRHYADYVEDERVYESMDATDAHSFQNAGSHVVGLDMRTVFGEETRGRLSEAINRLVAGGDNGPLARLVHSHDEDWDAEHERVRERFRRLAVGLQGFLSEDT